MIRPSDEIPKTFQEKLKEKLKELGENTTTHAIPNIIRSNSLPVKILWGLLFLGSFGYCLYTIISSIIIYRQFETVIKTQINTLSITEFPAITVCNKNPFNTKPTTTAYLDSVLISNNLNDAIILNLTYDYVLLDSELARGRKRRATAADPLSKLKVLYNTTNTVVVLNNILNTLKRSVFSDSTLTDSRKREFGADINDILVSCSFNNEDCSADSFTQFWTYKYGNCYTFNGMASGRAPLETSRSGSDYGLQLELFVGDPREQVRFSTSQGIHLIVHNYSTNPLFLDEGLSLSTGLETYISVERTFRYREAYPYSDCLSKLESFSDYSSRLFGYMRQLNISEYAQSFCYKMCFQDQLIDKCTCADTRIPSIRDARYCTSESELDCLDLTDIEFGKTDLNVFCKSACPIECNSINYQTLPYISNYPSSYYLNILKAKYYSSVSTDNTELETYFKKSILKVIVNYNAMAYTTITDNPVLTLEDIFGNVGGQFGLFLGLSILSFAGILETILEIIIMAFNHHRYVKSITPKV